MGDKMNDIDILVEAGWSVDPSATDRFNCWSDPLSRLPTQYTRDIACLIQKQRDARTEAKR